MLTYSARSVCTKMWTRCCLLAFLVGLAVVAAAASDSHAGNQSGHGGGGGHGDDHGGSHGVKLASWRWSKYKIYVILCITIILGTIPCP